MQRLKFNHVASRVPGPFALLIGGGLLIFLAVLIAIYDQLAHENAALQQQWQRRQTLLAPQPSISHQPVVDQALAAEWLAAQQALNTPWLALLQDLEQAQQVPVYWLQLAPDAKRQHLRMTVLAQRRQQGWAWLDQLKKQPSLTNVKLNASEATEVNGLRMTTLQLEAAWTF